MTWMDRIRSLLTREDGEEKHFTTKNAKKREKRAKALSHHRERRGTQRKSKSHVSRP
jgi:hypothetical protein